MRRARRCSNSKGAARRLRVLGFYSTQSARRRPENNTNNFFQGELMSTIDADPFAWKETGRGAALQKTKRLALGVLIAAAILYAVAVIFVSHYPDLSYVQALSEAAMVGALADWFAVEALFRHPLGLKIPHTRILPRNQERLGENLSVFIQNRFLATDKIVDAIKAFAPANHLIQWLLKTGNQQAIAQAAGQLTSYLVPGRKPPYF